LGPGLDESTKLYRYMAFPRLVSLIEKNEVYLSRITTWEDTWELPSTRIPIELDGKLRQHFPIEALFFGQCWSLLQESDAMWRIYSTSKEGVVIQTTVGKFKLLKEVRRSALAEVIYYDDIRSALAEIRATREYERFGEAFLKRRAFEHEKEVRFVTAADGHCHDSVRDNDNGLTLPVSPAEFIDGVTVDPRASDGHVELLQAYCRRSGLRCVPQKSNLYGDLYKQTGLITRYVTVKSSPKDREPPASGNQSAAQ
jgi:hypothetical protein